MGIVDQSGGRVSQAESLAADAGAQIKTHSSHGCFNLGLGTPARYRDNRKHRLTLYTRLSAAGLSPLSSRIVSYVCLSLRFFFYSLRLCVHVCVTFYVFRVSYTCVHYYLLVGVSGGVVCINLAASGGEAVCINVTLRERISRGACTGSVDPRVIRVLALCLHFLFFSRF